MYTRYPFWGQSRPSNQVKILSRFGIPHSTSFLTIDGVIEFSGKYPN